MKKKVKNRFKKINIKNNNVDSLKSYYRKLYQKELLTIQEEYNSTLAKMSAIEYSKKTGISEAAFLDQKSFLSYSYSPKTIYPDLLNIGTLRSTIQVSDSELMDSVIPYYHDFSTKRNIAFLDYDNNYAHTFLQNISFRILSSLEVQLIKMRFIDPSGFGQNFSYLNELSEAIRGYKILTETNEIERLVEDIKAHAVNLIQNKLKYQYENLHDYNANAGKLVEPYHFIFIYNFPVLFSQNAIDTLFSIINTSSKTDIAVFMTIDNNELSNYRDLKERLCTNNNISILSQNSLFEDVSSSNDAANYHIYLDDQILNSAKDIIYTVNQRAKEIEKITIDIDNFLGNKPFKHKSCKGLNIPIGLIGKDKLCRLILGADDSPHHGLICGATGYGKSILLHNIITNGAWLYDPDELMFVLLDYREGTEFKIYEKLPHVNILSLNSNRAFGLSVLHYLEEEMERRGRLFKSFNESKLNKYIEKSGKKLPRILIIIDEFQVLLKEHNKMSSKAASILDDISRRGRGFGIHMLISTQSLKNVNIEGSTLSNLALRISLKVEKSDAAKIFDDDNLAPSTLKKPGEAYYNFLHGQSEGNIRFQVAYRSMEMIQKKITTIILSSKNYSLKQKTIYEGPNYKSIYKSKLEDYLANHKYNNAKHNIDLYIGEPGYIAQNNLFIKLKRHFSSNLLIVGDRIEDVFALTLLINYQIYHQASNNTMFFLINLFQEDTKFSEELQSFDKLFPKNFLIANNNDLDIILEQIEENLTNRMNNKLNERKDNSIILTILNAQSASCLNGKEGMGGSKGTKKLEKICKNGPENGVHVILQSLQRAGLERIFTSRKMLEEFENKLILGGGNSEELISIETLKNKGLAYLSSPEAKYDPDPLLLYDPNEIVEFFNRTL